VDNIYFINYIVNRQLRIGKKAEALFVDLRAAFDSVDRRVLYKAISEKGIRKRLIERVKQVLSETKSKVRVGGKTGENFWTARGVRQGCLLSPLLFNIVIADLVEKMGRVKWGGIRLGERNIYTLAYADDIVLLSEDEEGIRSMINRIEDYLERKRLELNVDKTKIMRFRKGKERTSKKKWW